jgi:hypothetical protein
MMTTAKQHTTNASVSLPTLVAHLRQVLPEDKQSQLDAVCEELNAQPAASGLVCAAGCAKELREQPSTP